MRRIKLGVLGMAAVGVLLGGAVAQGAQENRVERARTLQLLNREVTVQLEETRAEDVVEFVRTYTGADIDVLWIDEDHAEGIDKDTEITLDVKEMTALQLLERVLDKTESELEENDWQLTPSGMFEMGPESRLNRRASLKIYDVRDLIYEVPNFTNVPTLDLDQILQQSSGQGGGGGGSIFEEDDLGEGDARSEEELVQELIDVVVTNIEPEQWLDNGGEGATIRYYRGTFLIKAPDYIHRQLGSYVVPSPEKAAR